LNSSFRRGFSEKAAWTRARPFDYAGPNILLPETYVFVSHKPAPIYIEGKNCGPRKSGRIAFGLESPVFKQRKSQQYLLKVNENNCPSTNAEAATVETNVS
jgi:hypothetical protein